MAHIGITCPPAQSHLNNMVALGRSLVRRGHRVTIFQIEELVPRSPGPDLNFEVIGANTFAAGAMARIASQGKRLSGMAGLRSTVELVAAFASAVCEEVPHRARQMGIDGILADQDEPGGAAVADILGVPYVTVSNALAANIEPGVPPMYTPFPYIDTGWARIRNRLCYAVAAACTRRISGAVNRYRAGANLPAWTGLNDSFSKLAQIVQQPAAFDLPRRELASHFHYLGPFRDESQASVPFPWESLDGRPIVYVSFGSVLSSRADMFRKVIDACHKLDVQLVISHVGRLDESEASALARYAVVVRYAPQLEVLGRAALSVSHGGLNTVLDSLAHAVPVLALPCMCDAFGTGVRLRWTGAGRAISWGKANVTNLREAINELLNNPAYSAAARRIRASISESGGLSKAAWIAERALTTAKPVTRADAEREWVQLGDHKLKRNAISAPA